MKERQIKLDEIFKNLSKNQQYFQSTNKEGYKEKKPSQTAVLTLHHFGLKQKRKMKDPGSRISTPRVRSHDKMRIITPDEPIETIHHKDLYQHPKIFINPTVHQPVRVQDVLYHLDIDFLKPVLRELYQEHWRFHFDPLPVFKTLVYWRLRNHRFLTDVHNDLLTDPTLADVLGYDYIPSYKQLYHFISYRLNQNGVKKIFDILLKYVIFEAENQGIPIGREIVIDSSPMEMKNNKDTTYNAHYKKKGYKWHNLRCVLTDIPLEYHVSTMTDYDGDFLTPLVYRLRMIHKVHPVRLFADGHYSDGKNLMRMREYFNIEPICHIDKNAVLKLDADHDEVKRQYQKLWKNKLFEPGANLGFMKWFLIMNDKTEALENFYHNQMIQKYLDDPEKFQRKYLVREAIEHCHGREKRHTEIKQIQANNIDKFSAHLGMHVNSLLCLALVRLQNGITENLVYRGGLI